MPPAFHIVLNHIQNLIGPVTSWPRSLRSSILRRNPNNSERFALTVFLLNNGVPIGWVQMLWSSCMDTGRGLVRRFILDDAANRQLRWVIARWTENPRRWHSWDMTSGRSTWFRRRY